MPFGTEVGLGPDHIVLDGDPAFPPQKGSGARSQFSAPLCCGQTPGPAPSPKGARIPQFSAHLLCQMAAWIKIPLGTEVGLGLRNTVLDGDRAPLPKRSTVPHFSANVRCGQTA